MSIVDLHRIVARRDQDPGRLSRHLLHHRSGENRRSGEMPRNEKLVARQFGLRHDGLIIHRNQPINQQVRSPVMQIILYVFEFVLKVLHLGARVDDWEIKMFTGQPATQRQS